MKLNIKSPVTLEKELNALVRTGGKSITLLDTGGVIDLVSSCRTYKIKNKRFGRTIYLDPERFLKHFAQKTKQIILGETFKEIFDHEQVKLNQFVYEIPKGVYEYLFSLLRETAFFLVEIDKNKGLQKVLDKVSGDLDYLIKNCFEGDTKKRDEKLTAADIALLHYSLAFSKLKSLDKPIITFSSDKHIKIGVDSLPKYLGRKYSIGCVYTRTTGRVK